MINLIPKEEQKIIAREFYLRLVVVFFALLSVVLFIALIALAPSYLLTLNKERIAVGRLEIQKSETMPQLDKDTVSLIKEIDSKMKLVENSEKNRFLVSESVINQIVADKMLDIKITRISFEEDAVLGERKVSVYGVAPSRERLLLFRRALEENSSFSTVNLPVSNFIKGSNIEFYLSLTLENSNKLK
jgi:hypothetical protein